MVGSGGESNGAGQYNSKPERRRWQWINRENILMVAGLALIIAVFVSAEEGRPFHYEFLVLAGGLCGLGVAQWGDKKK